MPPWPSGEGFNGPPLLRSSCYRFVLTNPKVHVVLTGPRNREQLSQNLDAIKQGPLEPDEDELDQAVRSIRSNQKKDLIT